MRGLKIALAAAVGGALLVPAAPLADEPPAPPTAALETASTTVPAGRPIELDSSASQPGSGAIVGHVWDLDGNGSFETDSGDKPKVEATPDHAGPLTVRVRVVDDGGLSSDAKVDLTITPAPQMQADKTIAKPAGPAPAPVASQSQPQPAPQPSSPPATPGPAPPAAAPAPAAPAAPATTPSTTPGQPAQPAAGPPALTAARMSAAPDLVPAKTLAAGQTTAAVAKSATGTTVTAAAASTGVTIKNFSFAPASSSVHVGDTITWTNQDIAAHTATATDGSFNTGTINQGKSGSHTFTKAGTFAYICSIHPSMKGTVIVAAATGSSSGGSSAGSSGSPSSGTTATPSSGSSLPQTGLDLAVVVLLAALMMAAGTALRRTAE